jgi:hypothetical protein
VMNHHHNNNKWEGGGGISFSGTATNNNANNGGSLSFGTSSSTTMGTHRRPMRRRRWWPKETPSMHSWVIYNFRYQEKSLSTVFRSKQQKCFPAWLHHPLNIYIYIYHNSPRINSRSQVRNTIINTGKCVQRVVSSTTLAKGCIWNRGVKSHTRACSFQNPFPVFYRQIMRFWVYSIICTKYFLNHILHFGIIFFHTSFQVTILVKIV